MAQDGRSSSAQKRSIGRAAHAAAPKRSAFANAHGACSGVQPRAQTPAGAGGTRRPHVHAHKRLQARTSDKQRYGSRQPTAGGGLAIGTSNTGGPDAAVALAARAARPAHGAPAARAAQERPGRVPCRRRPDHPRPVSADARRARGRPCIAEQRQVAARAASDPPRRVARWRQRAPARAGRPHRRNRCGNGRF